MSRQEVKEMKQSDFNPLLSVSPIDGRYWESVSELSGYVSEFAYIKERLQVEIAYLIHLSENKVIRKLKPSEKQILISLYIGFGIREAEEVKRIEKETRHDLKAIEYYARRKLEKTSLSDISEFIHFGLTSEDINNIAIRLMLKNAWSEVVLIALKVLDTQVLEYSKAYRKTPMLARTHGQVAVPTTLGKELLVFHERIQNELDLLQNFNFNAKLNGATGNYNALFFSYPRINWLKFSKQFINSFSLNNSKTTTQIAPYEDIIYFFQTIQRINGILLDFNQDMWRYISDGWFTQTVRQIEVGSSTMPQKVNPILFENSEGNVIVANSLISGFVDKLPISRLQRDLSGSTISRNFGVALAYSLLAYKNCLSGLLRIKPNKEKILEDLNSDWSILSEAVQIYLKKNGVKNGYEIIKNKTRGQRMTKEMFWEMIDLLPLQNKQKGELKKLSPENYIGLV